MILKKLKEATSGLHRQTEALAFGDRIASGELSLAEYTWLLKANYFIYASLEHNFRSWQHWIDEHLRTYEDKSPWLKKDLVSLGTDLPARTPGSPFGTSTVAALLGSLYVVEGSTLGGRYILKILNKNPALKLLPHRFFQGYGTRTGPHWQEFSRLCEQFLTTPETEAEAIDSAVKTFAFFHSVYQTDKTAGFS